MIQIAAIFLEFGLLIGALYFVYLIVIKPVVLDYLRYKAFAMRDELYRMQRSNQLATEEEELVHQSLLRMANAIISSLASMTVISLTLARLSIKHEEAQHMAGLLKSIRSPQLLAACVELCQLTQRIIKLNSPIYIALGLLFRFIVRTLRRGQRWLSWFCHQLDWIRLYADAGDLRARAAAAQ